MKQSVIIFEAVNTTDKPDDILVIVRHPEGAILCVDTPEAATAWYLKKIKQVPQCHSENESAK